MKRTGHLMEAIANPENLRLAFWKAARGKRSRPDCRRFQAGLDVNLGCLREQLLAGEVPLGQYRQFKVFDPKERTIRVAGFRERVMHHALMNHCEPILDRAAVFDSYACRKGKGRLAAIDRALGFARRYGWFLKMDVRKYFDSVDHATLMELLERKFKDPTLLSLFARIVASHGGEAGRGLPIGNLTSQHFANYYLAPLDRFLKERWRRRAYVRYMDDLVVWGHSTGELCEIRDQVQRFLAFELKLELKPVGINRTALGMDFLGFRLYQDRVKLSRRSKLRFARKFRRYERSWREGRWTELQLQQRMQALLAFVVEADSVGFRRRVLERFGMVANGLLPRETWRQLEQQRQELPLGEPQQQQAGQSQQQPGLPPSACPSSTLAPDGAPVDPAAIPSRGSCLLRANTKVPPGAGSGTGSSIESSGRRPLCAGSAPIDESPGTPPATKLDEKI